MYFTLVPEHFNKSRNNFYKAVISPIFLQPKMSEIILTIDFGLALIVGFSKVMRELSSIETS